MEADSAMRFVDLPFDLIQRICRRLGPVDVCELSLTCKAFRFVSQTKEVWYGMARAHLMQNDRRLSEGVDASVHENETGVQYYNRLHRESRIQYANELTVTWADDPRYYEWATVRDSVTPHVLRLRNVCWLNGVAVFPHVQAGYYRPVWRILLNERMYIASSFVMQAGPTHKGFRDYESEIKDHSPPSPRPAPSVRRVINKQALERHPRGTWINIELPVLWVDEAAAVSMRLINHSPHWKSGLLWDCARLVRVRKDGTPYCCTQHDQTPHSSVIPTVGGTSNSSEGASTETGRIAPGDEQGEDEVVSGLENVQRVMRRLWEAARRVSAPQND